MLTQFYIIEVQQYEDGTFGDIKHIAYDEDPDQARLKAESKFYEVLASAAISKLPMHSAILFKSDGFPVMYKSFTHTVHPEEQPEDEES